jgi:hypothetical protein
MRDRALHTLLRAFTADAAGQLAAETAHGAEIPFELIEAEHRPGQVPLYCYRPLTRQFIDQRLELIGGLPSYVAAVRALSLVERVGAYLASRGARPPAEPRARGELALRVFLQAVFDDRSQFGFDPERFELAYHELEETLYEGQSHTTLIAPLLGLALDRGTTELPLGDGLSLIRGEVLEEAPEEAIWDDTGRPHLLAMVAVPHDPLRPPPPTVLRHRLRLLVSALRLFERGTYGLGAVAWIRVGGGRWRPTASGGSGRGGLPVVLAAEREDELRAFCNLAQRRPPPSPRVAWALARFELGAERELGSEALTDYLLGLRALLEPEGPASGRLPWRVAAICAPPDRRSAVTELVATAIAVEQEVIAEGAGAELEVEQLVEALGEHLRALLRDIMFGHLDPDPVPFADELLGATDDAPTAEQPLPFPAAAPHSAR